MKTDSGPACGPRVAYWQARLRSFGYAFAGLRYFFRTGANARVQLFVFLLVVSAASVLGVTRSEAALLLLASGAVFAAEMINTAIEEVLDHLAPGYHPAVGRIKDLAAGAVLLLALAASATGLLIFIPKLRSL